MTLVLGKIGRLIAAVVAVSFLTFLLCKALPGDPGLLSLGTQANEMVPCAAPGEATTLGGPVANCQGMPKDHLYSRGQIGPPPTNSRCTAAQCTLAAYQFDHDYKLDEPVLTQYWNWASHALQGDFGVTYTADRQPVSHLVWQSLPATLEFLIFAEVLSLLIAIPLGVWSAYRENRFSDQAITGVSFLFLAFPNFVLAVFLIAIFAVGLHWLPVVYTPWSQSPTKNLESLIIPVGALVAGTVAVFTHLLRTDMIATLQEDFILMARSKGLPPWRVLFQHALRPSSFSLLTVAGINLGTLIGGTVILEVMFSANGLGYLLTSSIYERNYTVIQAVVLLVSAGFVAVNVLVDILYSVLDPRIRKA